MVDIVRKQRKPPLLTPSSIPCLRRLPTINITQGCSLGCSYCYIKNYRDYPGPNRIVLFDNTPGVVRDELTRKRKQPTRVYFSPSSDAFQYLPEVQQVTYDTMNVLLESGVEIAFLTKGFVSDRFLDLFARYPKRVHAQVGITSLDPELWRILEPRTACPRQRMDTIRCLRGMGINVTARLDPLIPELTDTATSLAPLLRQLSDTGVTFLAASYLFLRAGIAEEVIRQIERIGVPGLRPREWKYQPFVEGCGGGRCLGEQQRRERFARLACMGNEYGITVVACRCKNPSLSEGTCHIAGFSEVANARLFQQPLPLFEHS